MVEGVKGYRKHWGSDADAGWGAWGAMTGWIHPWITSVLTMRQMNTSLWDLTSDVQLTELHRKYRPIMIPNKVLQSLSDYQGPMAAYWAQMAISLVHNKRYIGGRQSVAPWISYNS